MPVINMKQQDYTWSCSTLRGGMPVHWICILWLANKLKSLLGAHGKESCTVSPIVINAKFLLVIPMLNRLKRSWELRSWSTNMNNMLCLTISPHFFYKKRLGRRKANMYFDIGHYRVDWIWVNGSKVGRRKHGHA